MENNFLFILGVVISCSINNTIIFQFIEERYARSYYTKVGYILLQAVTCFVLIAVNTFGVPIVNMLSWLLLFTVIVIAFYTENGKNILQRVVEVIGLILILSICETVGCLLLEFALWKFGIYDIPITMLQCLNMIFSKLVIIVFYYFVISKVWKSRKQSKFTPAHYVIYVVLIVYSIVNLTVVIFVVSRGMAISFTEKLLLLINMFCIVFADLYFVYFTKFTEENGQLKMKLRLLEQQADLQYEYYAEQEEKYNESVKILHDVNKHLDMLKEIYELAKAEEAWKYADEIGQILKPLILHDYISNPILNIILNDKKRCACLHGIEVKMEIENIDLGFMEPTDITTVFGNLLDNAISACDTVFGKERFIHIKLSLYNDFIAVRIANTSRNIVKWNEGKPVSDKGKDHGIGLINVENVIRRYNGSMLLEEKEGVFTCNIIFNP